MGIYIPILGALQDKLKGNKLTKPDILKPVDEEKSQLNDLRSLLEEVSDDQKEKLEKEIYNVTRGLKGEKNIEYELKNSDLPLIALHDINLTHDERSSQIDFVIICTKCIVVLESKNLYGEIIIKGDDFFINNFYNQGRFYNPISQNEKHVSLIKNFLKDKLDIKNMPIYSLVVFSDASTKVNKNYASKEVKDVVINYDNLKKKIVSLMDSSTYETNVTLCYKIAKELMESDTGYKTYFINYLELSLKKDEPKVIQEETKNLEEENNGEELIDKLKNWRNGIAKNKNIPAYYIFNNDVLAELINTLPKTKIDLINISGFGETKVSEYGDDILRIINGDNYSQNNQDYQLYIELFKWRSNRAYRYDIDEDRICTDEILENVAKEKPINQIDLMRVTGFDEKKYKYNGEEMINIIKKYK